MALRGIAFQSATIVGAAIGGLLFAVQAELVYAVAVTLLVAALACVLRGRERTDERLPEATSREALFAGARFVRRTPCVRRDQSRPLRRAFRRRDGPVAAVREEHPRRRAVGSAFSAARRPSVRSRRNVLAQRPIRGNAGRTLFIVVAIFGAAHIVFGLSKSFPLSCAALAIAGFADMFSMNIRSMTVALATPDELRGRVNAVEMVFISGSKSSERSSRA